MCQRSWYHAGEHKPNFYRAVAVSSSAFADILWFQHHPCLEIRILALLGANLITMIVGCVGNAEGCSKHVRAAERLSLNTTSSAEMERGDWCSDPGIHWAVAEWQECCHSTGIRQACSDFPHQERFLRNGLKATFFFCSFGNKIP